MVAAVATTKSLKQESFTVQAGPWNQSFHHPVVIPYVCTNTIPSRSSFALRRAMTLMVGHGWSWLVSWIVHGLEIHLACFVSGYRIGELISVSPAECLSQRSTKPVPLQGPHQPKLLPALSGRHTSETVLGGSLLTKYTVLV